MGRLDGVDWKKPDAPDVLETETEDDIRNNDADRINCSTALAASLNGKSLEEAEAAIAGVGEGCTTYNHVKDGDSYRFRVQKKDILGFDVILFAVEGGVVKDAKIEEL